MSSGPGVGDALEVEWPCQAEDADSAGEVSKLWFRVRVVSIQEGRRPRYLLRFDDDGGECWNSLRQTAWRRLAPSCDAGGLEREAADEAEGQAEGSGGGDVAAASEGAGHTASASSTGPAQEPQAPRDEEEVADTSGFVHRFELDEELLAFCDWLHEARGTCGDKTRGDAAYGEPLSGGLVSVVVRREALPQRERDLYNRLHRRCVEEVPLAWPGWLRKLGGKDARARPSQDLRLLQYAEGANFKAHVDSGWACQALVYLNEDFRGGRTRFPNLGVSYAPRRGAVLMWRSVCVGHRPASPGSLDDHPASHVAGPVFGGVKRVVSIHLVVT